MRVKIGSIFMFLGTILLLSALALYAYNQNQDNRAGEASVQVLPRLVEHIPEEPGQMHLAQQMIPVELRAPEDLEMTEVVIDGDAYIGYLTIPELELELPILADWSYSLLKKAPCRYTGSTKTDNLVLMAHNYDRHFGRLSTLSAGDRVYFTDMDGLVTGYVVAALDILQPDAVEDMTAGEYDLTLFTCTYGGKSRVTVRCDRTEDIVSKP